MKNIILTFLLASLVSVCLWGQSVNVEDMANVGKKKLFRLNGGLSAGSVLYGGSKVDGRQDWTYSLSGNLNISILQQISIPVSLNLTNLGANLSYPSLPNRLSLHPTYKWITAHIGDVSMTFSPYTLSGHQFTGGGVELSPGKFKMSAMGGRLLRRVEYDSQNSSVTPNYARYGWGVKTEYDASRFAVGFTYFGAQDTKDDDARIVMDNLGIHPMKNTVFSISTRLNAAPNLTLAVESALSLLTRDSYAPKDGSGFLNGLLDKRTSTNAYKAINAKISYQFLKNSIGIGYERIDPDYKTLGAYYFNNDYENITLNYARPFLKGDKANVAISAGIQHDDLDHGKEESTSRYVGSVNLNYSPSEKLQTSFNFSTFQSYRNIKSQFDYINQTSPYQNLDTLNFTQLSQNMDVSIAYSIKKSKNQNQQLSLNLSYQESADGQGGISTPGNVSRFANSSLGYVISFVPQGIDVNASLNTSYNYGAETESYTLGPTLGVTAGLLKKMLRVGFSSSYNVNVMEGETQAKVLNVRCNASYRFFKKHNLNASFIWQNRRIINRKVSDLTTTTVSYSYSF